MSENKVISCQNVNCTDGIVDTEKPFRLKTNCNRSGFGFRCKVCGLLHTEEGNIVTTRPENENQSGEPVFVDVNGKVVEAATV